MTEKTYREALTDSLFLEMRRDENVFVLGENFDLSGQIINSFIGGENHHIEEAHNIIVFGKEHTVILYFPLLTNYWNKSDSR